MEITHIPRSMEAFEGQDQNFWSLQYFHPSLKFDTPTASFTKPAVKFTRSLYGFMH